MRRELTTLINERISRQRETIRGHALSAPYQIEIGGETAWAVDVLISSDAEKLVAVPIAETGRNVRDFVTQGSPVELRRSNAGQFYVVGLADRQKGNIEKNTYSLVSAGLAFAEGWRKNGEGDFETGNENESDAGTPGETIYSYVVSMIAYGNLDYGTTPYGATEVTRTP